MEIISPISEKFQVASGLAIETHRAIKPRSSDALDYALTGPYRFSLSKSDTVI